MLPLYVDNQNITYFVISGSLESIGYEDSSSITFNELISRFNYDNVYAKVGGKNEHYANVKSQLINFSKNADVTFPLINNKKETWLRYTSTPILKNTKLISVVIDNVTDIYQHIIENYEKMHRDSLTKVFNKNTLDYHMD